MLEPFLRQRTGIFLNGLGAAFSLAAAFIPETVTSATGGVLPLNVLMLFAAAGFALRTAGFASARRNGTAGMAWAARVLSWVVFAVPGVMLGLTGSPFAIAALGAFVVLDAAGGFAAREADAPKGKKSARKGGIWKRMKTPLIAGLYLTFVALVHFSVSIFLPFGVLLTWSLLALGFALLLRAAIVGPKANEKALRAPADHRRHERREEAVPDPQRQFAAVAIERARRKGDASALAELARQIAQTADLDEAQTRDVEQRLHAAASAKKLRSDDEVHRILDQLDALLSPPSAAPASHSPDPRSAEAPA